MTMTKDTSNRRTTTLRKSALAAISTGAIIASGAVAVAQIDDNPSPPLTLKTNYLGYAASVSPRVGYSDNINLAPNGLEEDEIIGSVFFSGNAVVSTKAFTGLISGAGTATISENLAYFDVSGSTSRQLIGDNARFSQNLNAARNEQVGVHSFSLSPFLNRQFENGSAAELRYRFTQVFVDNGGPNPIAAALPDSRSQQIAAKYDTGDRFDRVKLGLTAIGTRVEEYDAALIPDLEYDHGYLVADLQVELTDNIALAGSVGVDEFDSDASEFFFPAERLSEMNWTAGVILSPSRRTSLEVRYGERFGESYFSGNLQYKLSDRVRFSANAGRDFRTRAQALSTRFRISQLSVLELADQLREGYEIEPEGVIQSFLDNRNGGQAQVLGVSISDFASANLTGVFDRTRLSLGASYSHDDFNFRTNEGFDVVGSVEREFSRRLRGYANAFYRYADTDVDIDTCALNPAAFGLSTLEALLDPVGACTAFAGVNGKTNTVGGRVGASYQIYRNLAVFGEYAHTTRFSENELLEFDENVVQAGLTLDF